MRQKCSLVISRSYSSVCGPEIPRYLVQWECEPITSKRLPVRHEGRHEAWGVDAATWARSIATARKLAGEIEEEFDPRFAAWVEHGSSPERTESPTLTIRLILRKS